MKEKKLSTYDIARASGDKINANTITRILNGDIKEAKLSTLTAIASGLGVPEMEILRIASGKEVASSKTRLEILAETFDGKPLTESDWQDIDAMLQALVEQKRRRIAIEGFVSEQSDKEFDPINNIFNEDPTEEK